MTTIKDIFKTHGPEYVQRFEDFMPPQHLKAIAAITNCKTNHYGATIYGCKKCGRRHIFFRSCGNRHCPGCQHHKTRQWLNKQIKRQLPGHHFMITFTVPQQLRGFIRSNQRKAYSALFSASAESMKKLAQNPNTLVRISRAFLACCTPGDVNCSTIPISTISCPAAAYQKMTADGILPESTSTCQSGPCPKYLKPSLKIK